jgi:hypothetical protein
MAKTELAQVVDREGLDAAGGARGRLRLAIPAGWARDGAEIQIAVPARVSCARCDGGGCDGCARSGAHRTPDDPAERTLTVRVPAEMSACILVRFVKPFGEQAPLDQLLVELSAGNAASPGVTRVELELSPEPEAAPARAPRLGAPLPWVLAVLAVVAAAASLLASR